MLKALVCSWIITIMMGFVSYAFADNPSAMNPRYVIRGDSVYDTKTDLTWARCSVGQRWKDGVGCEGTVSIFAFDEAQQQGGGGWRVPTKNELMTLIVEGKPKPTIDEVAFPNMDMQKLWYWTSTPDGPSYGWNVFFYDGSVDNLNRYGVKAVRLVRGGK